MGEERIEEGNHLEVITEASTVTLRQQTSQEMNSTLRSAAKLIIGAASAATAGFIFGAKDGRFN